MKTSVLKRDEVSVSSSHLMTGQLSRAVISDSNPSSEYSQTFDTSPKRQRLSSLNELDKLSNQTSAWFAYRKAPSLVEDKEIGWWIGRVTKIKKNVFEANLEDLSSRVSIVEIDKSTIDPLEQDLLFVNSTFTYSIYQVDKRDGREYKTKLSFSGRRRWRAEFAVEAEKNAKELTDNEILGIK